MMPKKRKTFLFKQFSNLRDVLVGENLLEASNHLEKIHLAVLKHCGIATNIRLHIETDDNGQPTTINVLYDRMETRDEYKIRMNRLNDVKTDPLMAKLKKHSEKRGTGIAL